MSLNQKKTNLEEFNNSWYKPGNKLKIIVWYLMNRLFINTYLPYPVSLKLFLLKIFGCKLGKNVTIKPKINIKYPWFLKIYDNVWIGENVWIDNLAKVTIASNVCISQGAMLLCGNHNFKKSTFDLIIGKITLEEGVWIGAQTVICPGVTCKSHSVLTVGSVATKDLEPYSIYQGNPAKKIKERVITE
jgi:putative colanic acid biosynthesis acetyltransferase WcaF